MPRRRDVSSCATDAAYDNSSYDLPLHVGAVFIVLAVSSLACAFPLLVLRFPRLRIPPRALFAARHFGTGVLLATAFVHLLPTAFQSLGDPCLSDFWTVDYPAMPGAVALGAIFLIAGLEMVFSPEKGCCAMPVEEAGRVSGARPNACCSGPEDGNVAGRANDCHGSPSNPETLPVHSSQSPAQEPEAETNVDLDDLKHGLSPEQEHKKALMQCLLLEMGILFHSVFIGMNLSVSTGREFVVLLVAIIFHQAFEGLALGARISALKWPDKALKPWAMCLAYGCTTPIGQAIGLALHSSYRPDSESGLLLVGIMNAISSGLLVYASLTELLAEDFLSSRSWRVLRGMRRVFACSWVVLGAVAMSLVGAWA